MFFEYLVNLKMSSLNTVSIIVGSLLILSTFWGLFWGVRMFTELAFSLKGFLKFLIYFNIAFVPFFGFCILDGNFYKLDMYSKEELKDLILTSSGCLYRIIPEENKKIGDLSLKKSKDKKLLGKLDCNNLSFKLCVEHLKNNKNEIISQIESSGHFTIAK